MSAHIGIVGVSPEGAALFYQQLSRELSRRLGPASEAAEHPRITLHNKPIGLYLEALRKDDWFAVGGLLKRSAELLASVGADFCLTPDHAVQHGVHVASDASPIPWISMPDLVAEALEKTGVKSVGILGTSWVTRGSTYQTLLGLRGIKVIAPEENHSEQLDAVVFNELLYGRVTEASARFIRGLLERFLERGCEGVILASSEIPLLLPSQSSPLPMYDASEILASGVVTRALAKAAD